MQRMKVINIEDFILKEMKHFNWMVLSGFSKRGIHFYGTQNHIEYIFFWNPIYNILNWITNWKNCSFGWFPFIKSHINWKG